MNRQKVSPTVTMTMNLKYLCALGLFLVQIGMVASSQNTPLQCDFFTSEDCEIGTDDERCWLGTTCDPAPERKAHCMASWTNISGIVQILRKGCWGEDDRCLGRTDCFEDQTNPSEYFCCCQERGCNGNYNYHPAQLPKQEAAPDADDVLCEYIDIQECENGKPEKCNITVETCDKPVGGKVAHCYAFERNVSGEMVITKKGCWLHDENCMKSSCIADIQKDSADDTNFCCCTGSMCNVDIHYRITEMVTVSPHDTRGLPGKNQLVMTLIYSLVPICIIALAVMLSFWLWRKHRAPIHQPLPTREPSPIPSPSPTLPLRSIQLLEVKARGRFGCVWKAKMSPGVVAVKIFPLQDRQSFVTEKEIYQLPYFGSHENILKFICGEKRGENLNMELWLITEFHQRGSLYDYLKGNLVSWTEALKIAESITKGLAFLHDVIPSASYKGTSFKPAVVHRDFKSKNVLVKQNMEACIADFGLAMKFDPGKHCGDTHGQVGTRRYMAPEVLEGSINFSCDHFMRIDMYACGLVLWEITSRCSVIEGPVDEYQLPFEDDVGQHPTLEDMQEIVVQRKKRPLIRENWLTQEGMASLCQSIQECWDSDPEARLSAGCVQERISQLAQANMTTSSMVLQQVLTTNCTPTPPQKGLQLSSSLTVAV